MKYYHIWTIGCQMNEADSGRVAAELDALGYAPTDEAQQADIIVLNTCVVRQSAEDKAVGRLASLKPLKDENPQRVIALMGCMVGVKPNPALKARFPFVDVFMPPSDPGPLVGYLNGDEVDAAARTFEEEMTFARHEFQDRGSPEAAAIGILDSGSWKLNDGPINSETETPTTATSEGIPVPGFQLPASGFRHPLQSIRHLSLQGETPVTANVPIVYGCSHACTFCIIPFRRGVERSRPLDEIVAEVRGLVDQGVREVTLLGKIVGEGPDGREWGLCRLLFALA